MRTRSPEYVIIVIIKFLKYLIGPVNGNGIHRYPHNKNLNAFFQT